MSNPGILIVAMLALAVLYVLLPRVTHIFARYRDARNVQCPETGAKADVRVDASRAAFTSAFGRPRLRARWCSLWPARRGCGQGCLTHSDVEKP